MTVKVHLITGAGSGMGLLSARRALQAGWSVAALDLNQQGLDALGDSPQLLKLVVDITDMAAIESAVARVEAELGPIDYVSNAAGIMPLGRLTEQPGELILKIMAINYGGLVNIAKATLPGMIARGRGSFVSFASIAGHLPLIYLGAYNASKFAVVAYTEVLHQENRDSGVKIVCVCPPTVATPLLDQARDSVWPKTFNILPPIKPDHVLDQIQSALDKGRFWVFPGPLTGLVWRLRRWLPSVVWWVVRKIERV